MEDDYKGCKGCVWEDYMDEDPEECSNCVRLTDAPFDNQYDERYVVDNYES